MGVEGSLIDREVLTETGKILGRVREVRYSADAEVESVVIASNGLRLIPEYLISTYELLIHEIVSSGPNRLIVFEGAEEQLQQLNVGILERFGLSKPPWKRNKSDREQRFSSWNDDDWGWEDDDTDGPPPISSPRRPKPGPRPNDTAEQPPTFSNPN